MVTTFGVSKSTIVFKIALFKLVTNYPEINYPYLYTILKSI